MTTHLHITAWALALILFLIILMLRKGKGAKVLQMILRLDYLLILYSGGSLLSYYFQNASGAVLGEAIVKGLAGLWVIVALEMISVKTTKGKPAKSWWIQLLIALIITLILGFGRLPLGVHFMQ
ncbi:YisL family protein [Virgibacillus sp. 179-BFC.A HS]|uniref:UPF0344 protein P5G51_013105 n=1 Tax=Tigheibacillus jepli TaxID=3035914 RepID=A0ABU5CIQ0_9BACI|nr:YisL family protein [Virgibacillus sp. 179-BFC.A HS]MDY0406200.1 YisL family protein [Virgibacillus sp. 179-BFC.A HS]